MSSLNIPTIAGDGIPGIIPGVNAPIPPLQAANNKLIGLILLFGMSAIVLLGGAFVFPKLHEWFDSWGRRKNTVKPDGGIMTFNARETDPTTISCPKGNAINMRTVMYGAGGGGSGVDVLNALSSGCNGQTSCPLNHDTLLANIADPAPGHVKSLQGTYTCSSSS